MGMAGRRIDRHDMAGEALAFLRRDDEGLRCASDLVLGIDIREAGFGDDRDASSSLRASISSAAFISTGSARGLELHLVERAPGGGDGLVDLLLRSALADPIDLPVNLSSTEKESTPSIH